MTNMFPHLSSTHAQKQLRNEHLRAEDHPEGLSSLLRQWGQRGADVRGRVVQVDSPVETHGGDGRKSGASVLYSVTRVEDTQMEASLSWGAGRKPGASLYTRKLFLSRSFSVSVCFYLFESC